MGKLKKKDRQEELQKKLKLTPFLTDEELADYFKVSVPTIRLDRMELQIPELRERIKMMAHENTQEVAPSQHNSRVGDILDITAGKEGISLLQTTEDMTDADGFVDPQYLYGQANYLARSVIGTMALTGVGNIKYKHPVTAKSHLVAKAEVVRKRGDKTFVWVFIKQHNEEVFRAKFIMETNPEI